MTTTTNPRRISSAAYADRLHCYFFTLPTYATSVYTDSYGVQTVIRESSEEIQIDLVENLREAIAELRRKIAKLEIEVRNGPIFAAAGNEIAYSVGDPSAFWGRAHRLPKTVLAI